MISTEIYRTFINKNFFHMIVNEGVVVLGFFDLTDLPFCPVMVQKNEDSQYK